jgi:DNA-binding response OmpR family regulator
MKILLLEDNQRLKNLILEALDEASYKVNAFEDGKEALAAIDDGYDCFILDINVPGIDGLALLEQIRLLDEATPAIIISANIELETIRDAYGKGCDEYLKKPFYVDELLFKVDKLCKPLKSELHLADGFSFDTHLGVLYENKNEIKLAKKEILLLNLMAKNLDKIVTFEMIEHYVWEGELTNLENVRALIKRLRKKLPPNTLISQGGMGYKLSYK